MAGINLNRKSQIHIILVLFFDRLVLCLFALHHPANALCPKTLTHVLWQFLRLLDRRPLAGPRFDLSVFTIDVVFDAWQGYIRFSVLLQFLTILLGDGDCLKMKSVFAGIAEVLGLRNLTEADVAFQSHE